MTKYDVIHENLQEKINNGELTLEDAQKVDNLAYEKYSDVEFVEEKADDQADLVDELEDLVKDGKVTLTDDDVKYIKDIIAKADTSDTKEDTDDDNKSDDSKDEKDEAPADAEGYKAEECNNK